MPRASIARGIFSRLARNSANLLRCMVHAPDRNPQGQDIPSSFERLPFALPHRLAELLGYPGRARFVGFYWEQVGDEVMFDDGQSAGTAEWYPFRRLIEHPRVAPLIFECDFGSSDSEPRHWLVIDRQVRQAHVAAVANARAFLTAQHPRRPSLTEEQVRSLGEEIHRLARQLPDDARLRAIDAFARKQHRQVERLIQFLDRLPLHHRQ